jgi:spore maturation protein CgeB
MLALFKEDKEAVYFSDRYELLKKIEWLLSNPSKIEEIAEAGYKRLLDDGHDIRSRSSEILKYL